MKAIEARVLTVKHNLTFVYSRIWAAATIGERSLRVDRLSDEEISYLEQQDGYEISNGDAGCGVSRPYTEIKW